VRALIVSWCVALSGCGGVGLSCTEIGCTSELSVLLGLDGIEGDLTVVVQWSDRTVTCTLPVEGDTDPQDGGCDDVSSGLLQAFDGGRRGATLSIGGLVDPGPVTVLVADAQGEVGRDTQTPTYETFQPNGPGCPPTCRVGEMTVDLSR